MKIVYDEAKRQTNLRKHRLDFADLDVAFFDDAFYETARNGRLKIVGWLKGDLVILVIAKPLGTEAMSVISMRRPKSSERKGL